MLQTSDIYAFQECLPHYWQQYSPLCVLYTHAQQQQKKSEGQEGIGSFQCELCLQVFLSASIRGEMLGLWGTTWKRNA